jgi:cyanophycin synthetase
VEEAKKRKIPVSRIGYESLVQLGYGKYSRLFESALSDTTSCISVDISSNKHLTKTILTLNKVPVPYGKVAYSEISAVLAADEIGMPVTVKPFDSNQGKGVHLNLANSPDVRQAFRDALKYSNGVIVEQYIQGRDYRVLVVDGKVKAVSERLPASVTGDGIHTIKELTDMVNLDPNRGESHEKPLTKIRLDTQVMEVLGKKSLNLESIPLPGENIILKENGNISTGGTAVDRTAEIHPDNAEIAVRAATAIGIDIAGIDMIAGDISQPIAETVGAVIEVNAAPGIRMHLYPSKGESRNVAKDIVDYFYPDDRWDKFKIISVTGTNGKTTTVRLITHVLAFTGKNMGMTSTCGTFINNRCICKGDNSGPRSARSLLSNKEIESVVLETARGGIVREGLGYDLADVGVITNIAEDHLGGEIETLEDLAHVKALVVEAVKPTGYAVLNAEDKMTPYILQTVQCNVILFYKDRQKTLHMDVDKFTNIFVSDNGHIRIKNDNEEIDVVRVNDIPITYSGKSECNIDNCLSAVAALFALKVPTEIIAEGLLDFKENLGRFNIYNCGNCRVMLDYAHNPAGYTQMTDFCKKLKYGRLVGIIGMPGDRPDSAIKEVGRICAEAFDFIHIKEDQDKRGRKNREVPEILRESLLEHGFEENNIMLHENELSALNYAIENAKQDDLIVILYEKIEPILVVVEKASDMLQ